MKLDVGLLRRGLEQLERRIGAFQAVPPGEDVLGAGDAGVPPARGCVDRAAPVPSAGPSARPGPIRGATSGRPLHSGTGQMAHGKLQCDAVRQAQRKTATASSTPAAGSTCFPSTATDPNRDRLDPRNPAGPQITVIERSSLPGRRAPGLACLVAISAAPDHADAASSSQATSPHSLWESASPSGACPCAAFSRARRHAQARAAGPVRYQGRGHSTCHQMPRGARSSSGHVRWSGVSTATR